MKFPYGTWECTHSLFKDFKVGETYECRPGATNKPRIYTKENSSWAPYWSDFNGRFCYPRYEIDFKYLGAYWSSRKEQVMSVTCEGQPDIVIVNGITYITGNLSDD